MQRGWTRSCSPRPASWSASSTSRPAPTDSRGPTRAARRRRPGRRLADGNEASIGELIITRTNDRKLRTSATDWVKNGDRWTVLGLHEGGDLTVQHTQHGRTVRLPREYVETSTELGYACTVHTAQGVTADTMHGLATGNESRQQLYTMLTRGKSGNHVYLEVVGDGDPHSVIHPTLVRPLTPTDILESMLARDDAQRSATSLMREQADPATRLGEAAQRYLDSLYVAAENVVGPDVVEALDSTVDQLLPGLADEAAWPTLRAHLLLLGAAGENPVEALRAAASDRELVSAEDRAAVLDWRLDASGLRNAGTGPLPWMPGVPERLADDPHWGAYLDQRAHLVDQLADEVRGRAAAQTSLPAWAQNGIRPDADTVADVEVWRAAMQVPVDDRRPTGAPQLQKASSTYQRRLNRRITGDHTPALKEWRQLLYSLAPQVRGDEFTPLLAERLAAMSRAGVQAHQLLRTAAEAGGHCLTSTPRRRCGGAWHATSPPPWPPRSGTALTAKGSPPAGQRSCPNCSARSGPPAFRRAPGGPRWSPTSTTDCSAAGSSKTCSSAGPRAALRRDVDECQALVWRTSIALEPIPDEHDARLPLRRAAGGHVGRRRARPRHVRRPPRRRRLAAHRRPRDRRRPPGRPGRRIDRSTSRRRRPTTSTRSSSSRAT